jgi:hypothetical protein
LHESLQLLVLAKLARIFFQEQAHDGSALQRHGIVLRNSEGVGSRGCPNVLDVIIVLRNHFYLRGN